MKQQTPFVQFENIQKSYDGKNLIVKDLNLDIYRGEFLTLLGPSGSGKTTSLMMLAGFETSTSGKITLGGKVLNQLPPPGPTHDHSLHKLIKSRSVEWLQARF